MVRTILTAARLVEVESGEVMHQPVVVVEGERITRVGPRERLDPAPRAGVDTVIDVPDGTLLPGFIEMHTHMHCSASADALHDVLTDSDALALLRATSSLRALLGAGVTTMRDIGSKNIVAFAVRDAVQRGVIAGPRVLVSGAPITTTGGHFYFMGNEADTVEAVVAAFRAQVKAGADHVKMMVSGGGFTPGTNMRRSQYRLEHVRAAAEEARRLHKPLVAHCHATEAIGYAAEAGVHDIVHCSWMTEEGMAVDEAAVERMIERGIYVDPTIAVGYRALERERNAEQEPRTKRDAQKVDVTRGTEGGVASSAASASAARPDLLGGPPDLQARLDARARRIEAYRRMWDRGVRFIVGTDSGMPQTEFGDWALSPELMVREMGLSPLDAIRAGTCVSARALGLQAEIGALREGMRADIVVVRGDPLADIHALYHVETVLLAGRVTKQGGSLTV